MKDLGDLHFFLGIEAKRTSTALVLTQTPKHGRGLLLPHAPLSVGQDQQDWLGGWKLTDPLERRTQRILNDHSTPDVVTATPNIAHLNLNNLSQNATKGTLTLSFSCKKWLLRSTLQIENMISTEEDKKTWQDCREALYAFNFSIEEADKILGKAYGQIHSPYWGEERKKVVPKIDIVKEIVDYLRSLSLSDDDLCKVLKKFPEVLGCNLDDEIKTNVQLLEKEWGIKGKSLRNLLLRNPKVLGYNVDCKGDCMAQCTRCWVRF